MNEKEREQLLRILHNRFESHPRRHKSLRWQDVLAKLEGNAAALKSLQAMEDTGGEPNVIGKQKGQYIFCDCSAQSPAERRSICYDVKARKARKEHAPKSSAVEMAEEMGIELLSEDMYRKLQTLGEFDTKTSSWIQTPPDVRALGGALFCDRRYNKVFVYHNGAESYYAARAFRGMLLV